ncbi:proline iminopeptidase-family hydrolase [Cryobacterium tagatosivorans]|uniref:proline iminopeptidase-family hydrolase n=1 Tax=Cryobacterium tagatosivorans TaxID=1259199 RepID=UPI001F545493|nr:proline iminopeptidase-family hydrolase [Cryobacterium tagatosivorans]
MPTVTTRTIPFRAWQTWVRITEPDDARAGALPLIVLHGGPGMAHNYVRNLGELADTGRTVIHYDQLGCGNSTHLPDAPDEFWNPQLFVDEFTNLVAELGLSDYHLLGQSWGGMLGAEIATRRPAGLRSLAICNSPASMALWAEGAAELRAQLPDDVQETLTRYELTGAITHPDYLRAADVFYERHVCRTVPTPDDFQESVAQMEAEPTVYHTMNGPNEFHVVGTLRSWSVIDRLDLIEAPTLVAAGEFDEATAGTWQPFVDHIPTVTSHVFPDASHCVHLEHPQAFRAVIGDFLARHDS